MEKPYVTTPKHPLAAVKAYIALAGALATGIMASGLLGLVDQDGTLLRILTGVTAIATAVATYKFPNAEVAPIGGDPAVEYDDGYDPEATDAPDTPLVPTSPEYEDTDETLVEEEPVYEDEPAYEPDEYVSAEPDTEHTFTDSDFGHGEPEQR